MKKIIGYLLIIIVSITITTVNAKTYLFESGTEINLNEEVEGTQFSLGETIKQTSNINGISFKLGNNIEEDASKTEYTFALGNKITIKSSETKDAFLIAEEVIIDENSTIDRDLYILANNITINGVVKRNIKAAANTININGTIYGELKLSAGSLNINENAKITKLTYNDNIVKNTNSNSVITTEEIYHVDNNKSISNTLIDIIKTVVTNILTTIVLILLLGKLIKPLKRDNIDYKELLKSFGKGFAFLVLVPVIAILLLVGNLTANIAIIFGIAYALVIALSSLAFNYYLAIPLLKNIKNDIVKVMIVSLILDILSFIPILGSIIVIIRLLTGIGLIYTLIKEYTLDSKNEA